MVDVITSIEILCPADKVSQFTSDPDNARRWYKNIKSVEWKTEKPLTVGSKIAFVAHFLGRKISYTYEVTEMTGEKFVMKTFEGPFPMETIYSWEKINDYSTRMTLRNRGVPSGFSKFVAPFMSIMMKKANQKDLKKLKALLEEK